MTFTQIRDKCREYWDRHTISITMTLLIILFIVALFWNKIVLSVDSGHVGVKWCRFTGTQLEKIYDEGLHIFWPWDVMHHYSIRIQTQNNTLKILTSQGLTIEVDYAFRFYPVKNAVPVLHRTLGTEYEDMFIAPEVKAAAMSVIGNYTPEQLYRMSTLVIQASIKYHLNKKMLTHNIVLEDFLIKRIILPESISDAIEKKMVAEQLALEFDFRLDIAEKEKKRKLIEAQGIKLFEETAGISILKWKGLEVTQEFASSENAKIIIMGSQQNALPVLFNADGAVKDAIAPEK